MRSIFTYFCLLGIVHGIELVPNPLNLNTTLITYNTSDLDSSLHYRNELNKFWSAYTIPSIDYQNVIVCEQGVPPREDSNEFCNINLNAFGPCTPEYNYKYNSSTYGPCIYLQSRKISNWVPEYYNSTIIPKDMPDSLKELIKQTETLHGAEADRLKKIWVTCEGKNSADVENIGPVELYPVLGFDGQYFPIRNEEHYIVPFVAVWFQNPKREVVITIKCKAWARNLPNESVEFEILVNQ